jgi:hypothetical protein
MECFFIAKVCVRVRMTPGRHRGAAGKFSPLLKNTHVNR